MKTTKADKQTAIEILQHRAKEAGARWYFQNTHHTYSTGTTAVQVLLVTPGNLWDLSRLVAKATGYRYSEMQNGVLVPGGGYCKGEHLLENLSGVLGVKIVGFRI